MHVSGTQAVERPFENQGQQLLPIEPQAIHEDQEGEEASAQEGTKG